MYVEWVVGSCLLIHASFLISIFLFVLGVKGGGEMGGEPPLLVTVVAGTMPQGKGRKGWRDFQQGRERTGEFCGERDCVQCMSKIHHNQ